MIDVPPRTRRGLWFAAGTLLVLLAAFAGYATRGPGAATPGQVTATPTTPPDRSARLLVGKPRTPGVWPGPAGLSGVNGDPVLDTAHVQQFCAARGRDCRIAHTYTDRTSYASMTRGSDWTFDALQDFDGTLVISQGLVPNGGEQGMAACAAGAYDQYWRDFGALMVRHARGESVVRLGWEMNAASMAWRGTDAAAYVACYRHAALGIRATNPGVLLDWTINAHNTPGDLCGGLSTNCYPGDDVVDIVGIDDYDHLPWSPTKADFDRTAGRPEGLGWLYEFARRRGKLFSVGEWGVSPAGDAGRENPPFVHWMYDWFAAHAQYLAYEAYFSDCTPGGVQSSLFRSDAGCRQNPASAEAYRSLFGE